MWKSIHPSQAAAWQPPSCGKQQAGERALQPHAQPFPPPGPHHDIFHRKGRVIPDLPPPGKDKLETLEP